MGFASVATPMAALTATRSLGVAQRAEKDRCCQIAGQLLGAVVSNSQAKKLEDETDWHHHQGGDGSGSYGFFE